VESFTEPPEGLFDYEDWSLRRREERRPAHVEEARPHGKHFAVRFAGCTDRDQAARLAGETIEVPRSALKPLDTGEYYRADLIGMSVRRASGELLGTVDHFIDTRSDAIMVVRGDRDFWVPATAKHLRRIDLKGRVMWIEWQEPAGQPEA
jgi:16S rRNA processing protein RimM